VDLDSVADELYGLPPEEFIATRTAREKQAKAAGDRELADAIRQLVKPNTVAWLANQLVREHRDEIGPLLELGAGLREATATLSGDELRTLGRQRHQLIYALVQLARALAVATGRKVSDDTVRGLESTLNAALADESAAALLLAGRLTDSLERTGFTPSDDAVNTPVPIRARSVGNGAKVTSLPDHRAAALEQARIDEKRAQEDLDAATTAQRSARQAADEAEQAADDARDQVEQLRADLDNAVREQTEADEARRRTRTVAERAEQGRQQAAKRLADASARRARLS
jgi:hypothetical protein